MPRAKNFLPSKSAKQHKQKRKGRRSGRSAKTQSRGIPQVISNLAGLRTVYKKKMRVTLAYVEPTVTVTSGAGPSVAGAYVFSANGLFDPNITGAGHQPLGFDQMMLAYNHYTVHSATINVFWVNGSASQTFVSVSRNADTATVTDVTKLLENGDVAFQILPINTVQNEFFKQSMTIDIARYEGVDDVLDDSDLRGSISANPVEQAYFHLSAWDPYSAAVRTANCTVELTYDVTFTEPKLLPLS